jgi:putative ABC transport system substrate-binding protein
VNRRELITLIGGAAAWPLAARAQQPTKVPHIGILTPAVTDATPALQAFHRGIRDLGYVEGQTIALDFRFSRGDLDALPGLAAELVPPPST